MKSIIIVSVRSAAAATATTTTSPPPLLLLLGRLFPKVGQPLEVAYATFVQADVPSYHATNNVEGTDGIMLTMYQ